MVRDRGDPRDSRDEAEQLVLDAALQWFGIVVIPATHMHRFIQRLVTLASVVRDRGDPRDLIIARQKVLSQMELQWFGIVVIPATPVLRCPCWVGATGFSGSGSW